MKKLKYTALAILSTTYFLSLAWLSYADVSGTTNTWLDKIIQIINADEWLKNRSDVKDPKKVVTQEDIDVWATSANEMNKILISSIKATGIANDGILNTADARELNDYIFKNYYSTWKNFHWDDDKNTGIETWYHRVQNDGGNTILFWQNALNTVIDGIYHLWFESSKKSKLLNEDGNNNVTFASVWFWLDLLLQNELKSWALKNWDIIEVKGTTNTWLDKIIDYLKTDVGLSQSVKTSDMIAGAKSADEMNKIIIDACKKTWVINDGNISEADVRELNLYIMANYLQTWAKLHGDDEVGWETWFHLVQNDGASKKMFGKNAVNTVFDGIYHLWYVTNNKTRLKNEDGNDNANFKDVATWLQGLMGDDIKNNTNIKNGAFTGVTVVSWDWYMTSNGYKWAYFTGNGIGLLTNKVVGSGTTLSFTMNITWDGKIQNGFLVFDYISPSDFKYAWARAGWKYWTIWEYKDGQYKDLKIFKETIQTGKDYALNVLFNGKIVILQVDWVEKTKYTFQALLNSKVWLWVDRSSVEFKKIQ